MELKITKVKTGTVIGNFYWTFVKIYAGEEFGIGEGYTAPQLEKIILEFSPLLIGENALDLNKIYDKLRWAAIPSGSAGITYHAISAIEIALLDLIGKHLNVPVYTLLGGKFREKVRMYVDTHGGEAMHARDRALLPMDTKWMREMGKKPSEDDRTQPMFGRVAIQKFTDDHTPKAYGSRAKQMKDEGFSAIKFDLDVPTPFSTPHGQKSGSLTNQEIKHLAELVRAVREAVGPVIEIMFDLHWKFTISSSLRLIKAVEPYGVAWMEDPVPPEDTSLLRRIVNSTSVPIASGELIYTRYGFARLLESGLPIVTPDSLKAGGLSETRFIAQLAAMNEAVISPHNVSSPIGTIAQAHMAASVSNFGVLEFHGRDVPIWARMTRRKMIERGYIELSDEPGLGIELDEEFAKKYALNDEFDL